MQRPILKDYGLTEEEYDESKALDSEYSDMCRRKLLTATWSNILFGFLCAAIGCTLVAISEDEIIIEIMGFICFAVGILGMIMRAIPHINRRLTKLPGRESYMSVELYRKQIQYEKAMAEYRNYVMDLNAQLWESLNQQQLINGLVYLFSKAGYKISSENMRIGNKKIAVFCSSEKIETSETMIRSVIDKANSGFTDLFYIAIGGFSKSIDDVTVLEIKEEKGITLTLLGVRDILDLAEYVHSLVFDESELNVLSKSPDMSSMSYLDDDPISVIDLKAGRYVKHKSLGLGIIDEIGTDRSNVTISFPDEFGDETKKIFKLPDSFEDGVLSYPL